MSTITLENVRATSDITVKVRLKDGGAAIDWSGLTDIRAWLYSDAQKALAGRFDVSVDQEDGTILLCDYSARKPQYLGVNRVIVQAKYMGRLKTYDKPCLNLVPRTADVSGTPVVLEDPVVEVSIEVTDVSSSVLDAAIAAALQAAADAEHAAHLIPNQVLLDCEAATGQAQEATTAANNAADAANAAAGRAPYIGENGHWWVWDVQTGAYVDSGNVAKGDTGNGIASWSVVESQEDGGNNVVTVTFTNGDSETFNVKNGSTGATPNITIGTVTTGEPGDPAAASMTGTPAAPVLNLTIPKGQKGDQGNTGSSVDYPFELVNNETTDDATKAHTAAGAKRLKDEISQLEAKVTGLDIGKTTPSYTTTSGYIGQDGTPGTSANYVYTSPISLKRGQTVTVITKGYDFCPIAQDGTPLTPLVNASQNPGTDKFGTYKYTAPSAVSVVACFRIDGGGVYIEQGIEKDYIQLSRWFPLQVGSFASFSANKPVAFDDSATTRARSGVLRTPLKIVLNSGYRIRSYGTLASPDSSVWSSIVSYNDNTLYIGTPGFIRLIIQKGSGSDTIAVSDLDGIVKEFYSFSDFDEYEKNNIFDLNEAKNELVNGSITVGDRITFGASAKRATMVVKIPCSITIENGYHFRNILLHNSINKDTTTIEKIVISSQTGGDPYAYISDPDYKYATVTVQKDGDGDFIASACNMKVYSIAPLTYNVKNPTKTNVPTSSYEQGGIGTTGVPQSGTTRVRVMLPLENNYLFGLNDKTNYRYFTRVYSENEMSSTYYLGTLSGQTETHDITKEEILAKYPTAKYLAIVVRNSSNTDLSPAEYLFVVGGYTQVNGFVRLEDEKENLQNNPAPHSLPLEHGSIIYDGTMSTKNGTANFLTTWRTPNFIELQDFSILTSAGTGTIFLYDSNYNLIKSVAIVGGTTTALFAGNFPQCKYFKVSLANSAIPSVTFMIANYSEVKNIATGAEMSFVYSVVPNNPETDADQLHKNSGEYFDNGFLRLPPNYSNTGKKTRLILFAHGSGDFTTMYADSLSGNGGPYGQGYNPYFDYLNKEGYAIFDVWGMTSKFWALSNSFRSAAWGTPTNMASITAAYKWLVRHYNLYDDGIFVCGKSLGGLICGAMMFQHSVPVLAVGSFAGDIDAIRGSRMGYAQVTRQQNVADLKFDDSTLVSRFTDPDQENPLTDSEFYQMLLDNKDHLAGYAPFIANIIDRPYSDIVPLAYSNVAFESVRRMATVPFKAWHSADDNTVSITQSRTFVKAIKNAGGIAELRVLPDGTGGHHATDYGTTDVEGASGYSLKADITTALGYECEDIPFAFIEFVEWIRIYE